MFMSSQSLECFGLRDFIILTTSSSLTGLINMELGHCCPIIVIYYRGSIICYSDLLIKIGAHAYKEIIESVSNALYTDNINLIAFKMAGKFRCVSFLVNNCIQYFPCAFDVPFCIR